MGEPNKRLYNLDLIRIIGMIMIIVLHFLGKSGLWDTYPPSSLGYSLVWATVTFCNVGVNIFVLISGYFLFTSAFKLSKLIALSCEVLFYSVLVYVGLIATGNAAFNPGDMLFAFFPIITGKYWFITMYVGMYMLSPLLNKMIRGLNQREHATLLCILVLFVSIWPVVAVAGGHEVQSYALNYGFSAAWFIVLYIIAAYFRVYYTPDYKPLKHFIRYVLVAILSIVTVLSSIYLGHKGFIVFADLKGILNSYTSPTVAQDTLK